MKQFEYIQFLGRICYSNDEEFFEYWNALTNDSKQIILKAIGKSSLCGLILPKFVSVGKFSSDILQNLRQRTYAMLVHLMRQENDLRILYNFLEDKKIRFIPIKGIDMAYRVYPSPSMRPFGDWDILFHPQDINKAVDFLKQMGWQQYDDGTIRRPDDHHLAPLFKDQYMLEPHRSLPCFENTYPEQIWQYTVTVSENSMQSHLTPELNLLMIVRHASEDNYLTIDIDRLLLDVSFLLRKYDIDWLHVKKMCHDLHQPYPGNLLAAFPEFFPPQIIDAMDADEKSRQNYRRIFELREHIASIPVTERYLANGKRFSKSWFMHILYGFYPANVKARRHLSGNCSIFKLFLAYGHDIIHLGIKTILFTFKRKNNTSEYLSCIKNAEMH